jgi:hypothetical protein
MWNAVQVSCHPPQIIEMQLRNSLMAGEYNYQETNEYALIY